MLGKMLIHGLVAAALVGSAAAVYAQAKDNGYLSPDAVSSSVGQEAKAVAGRTVAAAPGAGDTASRRDDGYIRDRKHDRGHEREHDKRRGHDRDDD